MGLKFHIVACLALLAVLALAPAGAEAAGPKDQQQDTGNVHRSGPEGAGGSSPATSDPSSAGDEHEADSLETFVADAALTMTYPGVISPIVVDGVLVGYSITGETFIGTMTSCSGAKCNLLDPASGSDVRVTQYSTFYFSPPTATGLHFNGQAGGAFTITQRSGSGKLTMLAGHYGALAPNLAGSLVPLGPSGPFQVSGSQNSSWAVTSTTDVMYPLGRAIGTLQAALGGIFPGGERIQVTLNGSVI